MRIIAGEFRGRKFTPPANKWPTRPTTDFAKEGLYNILQNKIDFEEVAMLDLFGGTGNHCYEFVSRGCDDVTYIEKFRHCVSFTKQVSKQLGIEDKITIIQGDVFKYVKACNRKFDIVFADPPYDLIEMMELPDLILTNGIINENGTIIIEHSKSTSFEDHSNFSDSRTYGGCMFSFFVATI